MKTILTFLPWRWQDETEAWENTGHPPSYAEAKKNKWMTLHIKKKKKKSSSLSQS